MSRPVANHGIVYSGVSFGLCTTLPMLQRELRRMKTPREQWPKALAADGANATTRFYVNNDNGCVVAIVCMPARRGKPSADTLTTIVHESAHIWQRIREYIGEDKPSQEFEACALQNIFLELLLKYQEQTRGKR